MSWGDASYSILEVRNYAMPRTVFTGSFQQHGLVQRHHHCLAPNVQYIVSVASNGANIDRRDVGLEVCHSFLSLGDMIPIVLTDNKRTECRVVTENVPKLTSNIGHNVLKTLSSGSCCLFIRNLK